MRWRGEPALVPTDEVEQDEQRVARAVEVDAVRGHAETGTHGMTLPLGDHGHYQYAEHVGEADRAHVVAVADVPRDREDSSGEQHAADCPGLRLHQHERVVVGRLGQLNKRRWGVRRLLQRNQTSPIDSAGWGHFAASLVSVSPQADGRNQADYRAKKAHQRQQYQANSLSTTAWRPARVQRYESRMNPAHRNRVPPTSTPSREWLCPR